MSRYTQSKDDIRPDYVLRCSDNGDDALSLWRFRMSFVSVCVRVSMDVSSSSSIGASECDGVQCSAMQYNGVQYNAMQWGGGESVRYRTDLP